MEKVSKIRYNGNTSLIHTREDIAVLVKAHNEMAETVNKLIDIVEEQGKTIKKLEGEEHER